VIKRRKLVAESDLKKLDTAKINNDFNEQYSEYQDNYSKEEQRR